MIGMTCKKSQQIKFLGRKVLLHSIDPHSAGCRVNLKPTDLDDLIGLSRTSDQPLITGKMGLYPCHKFTGAERLRHIIISSEPQSPDLINIIFFSGNHNDRCIFLVPHLTAYLKSVYARQHQIQDQQIVIISKSHIKSALSIVCHLYCKSGKFQIIFFQVSNRLFILYYQYFTH